MTLLITDLLDSVELEEMLSSGRIKRQQHNDLPLFIYNYTSKAQFANEWTNAERVCRGLIVTQWGEVIARGMPKFFNYGDPHGTQVELTDVGALTKKEDGSLGIGWTYAGKIGIATRGSFHSEQAVKATSMLTDEDKALIHKCADKNRSALFEIVYPDNRIVVEYGDREENIKLGQVDNETGEMAHYSWVEVAAISTLLRKPIPADEEGYVVSVFGGGMFKLKGEEYLTLHKLMFGLTEKTVWEMLQTHNTTERAEFVAKFPPITQQWVLRKMQYISKRHAQYVQIVHGITANMLRDLEITGDEEDRKRQALWLKEKYPNYLGDVFTYIDSGDEKLYPLAWKKIKPAHRPYKTNQED